MANSISTVEGNVFGSVTGRTVPDKYWLANNTKPKEFTIKTPFPIVDDIVIMTPQEAKKTHNIKIIGASIASATILTAAGLFFLLKGGPKGLSKNFARFRNFLEEQIQKSRLDNPNNPKINKLYAFLVKYVDILAKKFEVINNFTTLKDFAFKELMNNKITGKFTGKIHSKITKLFEKIGRQAVVNSYNSTKSKFKLSQNISKTVEKRLLAGDLTRKIKINGETKTLGEWAQILSDKNKEIATVYDSHFSDKELFGRYFRIKQTVNEMNKGFEKKGHFWFWSPDTLNSFVAESAISDTKMALQNSVKGFRREISYSSKDLVSDAHNMILKMTKSIDYKDVEKTAKLRAIDIDIKNLSKISNPEEFKIAREKIFKKMDDFTNDVLKSLKNKEINSDVVQNILEDMLKMRRSVKEFKHGKVEDILSIYEKLLTPEEFKTVKKSYDKALKSLDKSINIETEDFLSKVRDWTLGSAPTDVLTVLGAFGTLGYYLGKSDNKQERQSVLLRYGFPAIAGIGTSLYGNAKLFAGSKSLFFGILSSIIVGKIGAFADEKLQKYNK